jgi:hypothetical protein
VPVADLLSNPALNTAVFVATVFGPSIIVCLVSTVQFYKNYQENKFKVLEIQDNEPMQMIPLASSDTQLSAPLSVDRTIAIKKTIDMQEIMQSIYGQSPKNSTEMYDSFGTRYGAGYPRAFFGPYGDQRKTAKAIRRCLHKRCTDMPDNLTKLICTYVQHIDREVLVKLGDGGYATSYYNRSIDTDYHMVPTEFPWDEHFVESEDSTDSISASERRNRKGSADLSDIVIIN